MKNTFLMLLGLLLLLTGCNRAPAESGQAAAPKPIVTVTVEERTAAPTDLPLVEVTPVPTGRPGTHSGLLHQHPGPAALPGGPGRGRRGGDGRSHHPARRGGRLPPLDGVGAKGRQREAV